MRRGTAAAAAAGHEGDCGSRCPASCALCLDSQLGAAGAPQAFEHSGARACLARHGGPARRRRRRSKPPRPPGSPSFAGFLFGSNPATMSATAMACRATLVAQSRAAAQPAGRSAVQPLCIAQQTGERGWSAARKQAARDAGAAADAYLGPRPTRIRRPAPPIRLVAPQACLPARAAGASSARLRPRRSGGAWRWPPPPRSRVSARAGCGRSRLLRLWRARMPRSAGCGCQAGVRQPARHAPRKIPPAAAACRCVNRAPRPLAALVQPLLPPRRGPPSVRTFATWPSSRTSTTVCLAAGCLWVLVGACGCLWVLRTAGSPARSASPPANREARTCTACACQLPTGRPAPTSATRVDPQPRRQDDAGGRDAQAGQGVPREPGGGGARASAARDLLSGGGAAAAWAHGRMSACKL